MVGGEACIVWGVLRLRGAAEGAGHCAPAAAAVAPSRLCACLRARAASGGRLRVRVGTHIGRSSRTAPAAAAAATCLRAARQRRAPPLAAGRAPSVGAACRRTPRPRRRARQRRGTAAVPTAAGGRAAGNGARHTPGGRGLGAGVGAGVGGGGCGGQGPTERPHGACCTRVLTEGGAAASRRGKHPGGARVHTCAAWGGARAASGRRVRLPSGRRGGGAGPGTCPQHVSIAAARPHTTL